jgi:hypothetical protein
MNYGGPIPTETIDSSSAKIIAGITAGASYSIPLTTRLSFSPALYYSFHGLDYSQSFTRDTLVTVVFNNVTGTVPSYYTAYVNGGMRLHYADIHLLLSYSIWKTQVMIGPYFSVKVAGKDDGTVRIVIGNGGFFEDKTENFSNFGAIRTIEQGFMFGSRMQIYKRLSIDFRVSRSLFTLYKPGKLEDRGQGIVKMFNTFVHFGLAYKILSAPKAS